MAIKPLQQHPGGCAAFVPVHAGRQRHRAIDFRRRGNGLLINDDSGGRRCPGSRQPPAEDAALATWLPVLPGLTPHGLRHGHQSWMEEAGVSDLLRAERMGHEVPGMRGVYGHVTLAMRAALTGMLQDRWEASLRDRARLAPRSIVPVLDALLAARREPPHKIGSHSAPKTGHQRAARPVGRNTDGL
jgi:integrase